ncbi:MAG: DUF5069 domain-containing protein [Candidatus Sericytochromatia bacterium]|nr:DUF5069 domain-containing protein [Candidatus Sericytochromatia bacterium]
MPTFTVKDLTREFPRSPYETLDGIPWLARLIDKARAMKAGKLGEYIPYPCGGDRHFLGTLGLDADALKAEIDADKDDAAILAWVKARLPEDAEARLAAYSEQARAPLTGEMAGWLEGAKQELAAARPELDLSAVTTFGQLICVEEGHPLP